MKYLIGISTIMRPNFIVEVVRETPCTIIAKCVEMDFTPKKSKTFTHEFDKSRQEWFTENFIGREFKFWKKNWGCVGDPEVFIVKELN